ncbi:hypothetical protein CEK26_011352 [Fusarium fujikuroi]|nr:hypothetical protein CEK27_011371 [Fusarium fujikuroi]QGI84627.1 hypothetical protein CEK25_011356 [Fusarium fujikuroi]QGI98283.1 hypothetical protein CEK26_011352 [Fusarium fujikuroi]
MRLKKSPKRQAKISYLMLLAYGSKKRNSLKSGYLEDGIESTEAQGALRTRLHPKNVDFVYKPRPIRSPVLPRGIMSCSQTTSVEGAALVSLFCQKSGRDCDASESKLKAGRVGDVFLVGAITVTVFVVSAVLIEGSYICRGSNTLVVKQPVGLISVVTEGNRGL